METDDLQRMDRRRAIQWILAAGAGAVLLRGRPLRGSDAVIASKAFASYGTDPDLMKAYKAGDFWPLTFTAAQRRAAAALCDTILPADGDSPGASSVGVPDFIDEWVSAPYPENIGDRPVIAGGLTWIDAESVRRFGSDFAASKPEQREALCADLAPWAPKNSPLEAVSGFFLRFRDLACAGYYTSPEGVKAIGYVGNVPLARFDGPPAGLIARLGLSDEVKY